jgi:hypothetical protein
MPKIFVLRHQLAEQQARLKSQAKGSSGDSPTSGASDEEKLEQGPSSSSGDNCASDSRPNVTSQNYIVQNAVQRMDESDKSVSENIGSDNKNKDEQNAPLELITRQRSTGKILINIDDSIWILTQKQRAIKTFRCFGLTNAYI